FDSVSTMKRCKVCGQLKPLDDFYRLATMRDGHRNDCKACNLAAKAKRYRANPQCDRERVRRWQRENPERVRAWREAAKADGRRARNDRNSYLKRKYGITLEDYDRMLAEQVGVCAICGRQPTKGISLHVDHHHGSSAIRGLLCFRCNNAVGDFGDDPNALRRAADYIERAEVALAR